MHAILSAVAMLLVSGSGCVVSQFCFDRQDCPGSQICNAEGRCQAVPPASDGSVTVDSQQSIQCPQPEMVNVGNRFCLDRYEASRANATSTSEGTDGTYAANRPGVIPWQGVDLPRARAACQAAGKYLCRLADWVTACEGPLRTLYAYGNRYDPTICNGIDSHCDCNSGACAATRPCPYPHCFDVCGAAYHIEPTGSRPACTDHWGAFDLNGNLWELTDTDDGLEHFRGGAYNCGDSEALHRCDHDGIWGPSARGFRCCADGLAVDAGPPADLDRGLEAGQDAGPLDYRITDFTPDESQIPGGR